MKALMGDTADNIPGVPGVGEKTALKLISQFGSVTGVYEHLADVKGKKLQEKLADNKDKALLSKDLATIRCDLDLTYTIDQFQPQPRQADVAELFKSLGFRNLLERFAAFDRFAHLESGADAAAAPVVEAIEAPLADSLKDQIVAVAAELTITSHSGSYGTFYGYGKGAFTVPPEGYGDYLSVLPQAKAVITADGKNLTKAVSAVASGRLPLKDIILAAYLLDPTRTSYGLTYISETFDVNLQEPADDEAKRLVSDAAFALSVWPKVEEKMGEASLTDLYASIEEPLVRTLAVMEMNGFTVDTERLMAMKSELSTQADALEEAIYDDAGETFNISSPKQLGVILFEKLKLPVIKKTKTGYSTDSSVLDALMDQHPMIDKILRFRALKKLISTYLDGLEPLISPETGRIHTHFNQMVTSTGRLSSSDPNLQNIPIRTEQGRKIRSIFIPGDGYDYIVSGDYSQIELRLLAHLSQDPTMIDGFQKGQDIHRRTASEVFGIPWDEVTPEARSHAKAVNFGIIYGISDFGLARNISISRQKAKEYIESYFARYSTIHDYMNGLIESAKQSGMAVTMFGRRRTLPDINSKNFTRRSFAERTAMNTPIQGSAATSLSWP